MATDPSALLRRTLGGGALAGLAAGLVMVLGAGASGLLRSSMRPALVGLVVHFAIAAGWGALFGMLFYGLTRAATVATGLLWGLVVWLLMFYVVLPLAGMWQLVEDAPRGQVIVQHLVFGLTLSVAFLPFQRTIRPDNIAKPRGFYTPLEH